MPIVRRRSLLMGSLAATVGAPAIVQAQADWPKGPIKFVVPFPPGGSTDPVARFIQARIIRPGVRPRAGDPRHVAGAGQDGRAVEERRSAKAVARWSPRSRSSDGHFPTEPRRRPLRAQPIGA